MSSTRLSTEDAADVISDLRTCIVRQLLDIEGWTGEVASDARAVRYLLDRFAKLIAADGEADRELLIGEMLHDLEQAQQGLLSL